MKVVLIGDSIRIGYQPLEEEKLHGVAELWAPGENCRHGILIADYTETWIRDQQPGVVHLNCGLHDCAIDVFVDGNLGS